MPTKPIPSAPDMAFMVQNYDLAQLSYQHLKKDFQGASAWFYYAGAVVIKTYMDMHVYMHVACTCTFTVYLNSSHSFLILIYVHEGS